MRRVYLWLLLTAFVAATASCSSLAVAAATVNGEKITETAVESELDTLRDDPIFGEALKRDPDTRGQRRREILKELIYLTVAEQQAEKLRVKVTRPQVERVIDQAAQSRGITREELLEAEHITMDDARRLAGRTVLRFALIDKVVRGGDLDEKTIRTVYKGQQERFVEVHLERITVKSANEARTIAATAERGSDFAGLARDESTDQLAEKGGDMGYVPLPSLAVEVQGPVSREVEGGITEPIQTESGYQIYHLVDRKTKPFEDVADEIRRALTQDERDREFDAWLAEKVKAAEIVVNPKYGRLDTSQGDPNVVPSSGNLAP
jgi:foldase protein PrsA